MDEKVLDPESTVMTIFPSPMMYAGPTEVQCFLLFFLPVYCALVLAAQCYVSAGISYWLCLTHGLSYFLAYSLLQLALNCILRKFGHLQN